jgi:hypothetical protein
MCNGGLMISGQLQQMSPNGVSGSHDLGLLRVGESFYARQLSGFAQSLVEAVHERDVRLNVLLRSCAKRVVTCPRAIHHQNVFHVFCSFRLSLRIC